MRIFLIRLGFVGDDYKKARKILLRNLSGNSSWKSGHRPNRAEATTSEPAVEETPNISETETTPADDSADKKGGAPYGQ